MGKTNVLVLGNGMREHAIVKQLHRSNGIGNIFTSPGNAGTATLGKNEWLGNGIDLSSDFSARLALVKGENIGLVIIGPDDLVVAGHADELLRLGCPVFGPERSLAQLEGSKICV